MVTSPDYVVVLLAHIGVGIIGFGALGATGAHARLVRHCDDPLAHPSLRRFFRGSPNIAARSIFVVPVLGVALLAMQHPSDATLAYPWIGLGLWSGAVGLATAVIWPNERAIQQIFGAPAQAVDLVDLQRRAGRIEVACAATTLLFTAAFVVMAVQPG